MFFRQLLALLALLVVACAPQDGVQTASSAGRPGIPALPRELERDVGPAYPDATLQTYVDRVGQRLVAQAGLSGSFRFVVLDQPVANAHAAGGYVMVTRGLLALLDDEAELAAAMSHDFPAHARDVREKFEALAQQILRAMSKPAPTRRR